jgi:Zn-dependent protease
MHPGTPEPAPQFLTAGPVAEDPVPPGARFAHTVLTTPPKAGGGALLLVGSVVLVALSMRDGGSWSNLVILVAVLVFHELGHLAAMRLAGFADLRMFFVPFFGAAASGRKPGAGSAEHALVSLAGPLPGLLLAAGLLAFGDLQWRGLGHSSLWAEVVLMLVVLNGFNLLPILPFDGGRVFQVLLFGRLPWLDVAFRVLAIAGVGYLGTLEMPVLFAVAALMAIGLRERARIAFAVARLRRTMRLPADPARLTVEQLVAVHDTAVATLSRELQKALRLQRIANAIRDVFDGTARQEASLLATILLLLLWAGALAGAFFELGWLLH